MVKYWFETIIDNSYYLLRFEKQCTDHLIKEALIEAIPNKKIILRLTATWEDATLIKFKDGNMYLNTTPGLFSLYWSPTVVFICYFAGLTIELVKSITELICYKKFAKANPIRSFLIVLMQLQACF